MNDIKKLRKLLQDMNILNGKMSDTGVTNAKEIDLLVQSYLGFQGTLMKTNPETIKSAQKVLGRMMIIYAYYNSPVYQDIIDASALKSPDCLDLVKGAFSVAKSDLLDKERWYTPDFASTESSTSGTTGAPFKYKVWNDAFLPIEKEFHYKAVLDEFGIGEGAKVLHMVTGFNAAKYNDYDAGAAKIKVATGENIPNFVARLHCSHGVEGADMHHIQFEESAFFNIKDFCKFVVDYIQKNEIDVLLASGGLFEILCTHLITDETNTFPHLVKLMSNTGDRVNVETLQFMAEAGVTDDWCDHMRCWDGGATFMTCKNHVYHLMDDLALVYNDDQGKLMSIDFFAYPSPFINYWNGDYCEVEAEYKLCDCGRWHRPFKFLNRRPRSNRTKNGNFYDSQKIHDYLTTTYDVQFVSYQDNIISVEDSSLTDETKKSIVQDMAKEHIAVHFFTQKNLRAFASIAKTGNPTSPN
jgi:hypothetical protein